MQSLETQTNLPVPAGVDFVFHDQKWTRSAPNRTVTWLFIIPLLLVLLGLAVGLPFVGVPALVILVSYLFFLGWRDGNRRIERLGQTIRDGQQNLWWGVTGALKAWQNSDCETFVRETARAAQRAGHRGKVIWIANESSSAQVAPLEIQFEPLPLQLHEPRFVEFYQLAVPASHFKNLEARVRPRTEFGHIRRLLETNRVVVALAVVTVFLALNAFGRGRVTKPNFLLVIAWTSNLFFWVLGDNSRESIFVVPRGVVVRRSGRRKSAFSLRSRDDSLLIAARERGKFWRVAIGSESDIIEFRCEQCEVELLLAAWLSPLDAPTEEIIAGLT